MRNFKVVSVGIAIVFTTVFFAFRQKNTPNKLALIVAIGKYEPSTGWGNISSEKDIPLVKGALLAQGFKDENILIIRDKNATREGILNGIKTHLIDKAKPGDMVVFHYSGHGQQVIDISGDEFTGYDQALVPYDAGMYFQPGIYEGEKHLIDDDIEIILNDLRRKLGPSGSVLAILDACHSGTATRGVAPHRGTSVNMAPKDYKPETKTGGTRGSNNSTFFSGESQDKFSPMVVISGASADQLNYETKDEKGNFVGSLTYAFSRAMVKAGPGITYRNLFDMIKVDMASLAPRQNPVIEGDVDLQVFGGEIISQPIYFIPNNVYDKETFSIKAGNLQGIFDSTEVALFPIGTKDIETTTPIAKGIVINSTALDADVLLEKGVNVDLIKNSAVYVTSKNFGKMQVSVKVDIKGDAAFTKLLEEELKKYSSVKLTNDNPDLLVEMNNEFTKSRGANFLQVYSAKDELVYEKNVSEKSASFAKEISEVAKSYARGNFLRNLELDDASMKVTFEIIPLDGRVVGRSVSIRGKRDIKEFEVDGNYVFQDGTLFYINVKNEGFRTIYFTILDITAGNKVNVLIPFANTTANDFRLGPGEEKMISINNSPVPFNFTEPYGTEVFKLIATRDPLDLRPVVQAMGHAGTRGNSSNPFETLLGDSFTGTRAAPAAIPAASGSTFTKVFTVVPKEN